jgi:hypothetical protein
MILSWIYRTILQVNTSFPQDILIDSLLLH